MRLRHLRHLFTPKWKHPDPEIRNHAIARLSKEIVEKIEDQDILAQVATTALLKASGVAAINKLMEPHVLMQIVRSNRIEFEKAALKRLLQLPDLDDSFLMEIASITGSNSWSSTQIESGQMGETAITKLKLNHVNFLTQLAKNAENSYVGECAVGKIEDQAKLAEIAISAKNVLISGTATRKIKDQSCLAQVAREAIDYTNRESACRRQTDQRVIFDVALTDTYQAVRWGVVYSLKDQALLFELAQTAGDDFVSAAAVMKIEDNNLIVKLASRPRGELFRLALVWKLYNQDLLAQIAQNDPSDYIRHHALVSIATTHENPDVRFQALASMSDDMPEESGSFLNAAKLWAICGTRPWWEGNRRIDTLELRLGIFSDPNERVKEIAKRKFHQWGTNRDDGSH
jgi:hypothetical protein